MQRFRTGPLVLGLIVLLSATALGQAPIAPVAAPDAQIDTVEAPAWLANDIACAPSLTTEPPPSLRVIGSQDTIIKHMLGPGDTLVLNGGSSAGLQPGQRLFVRRNVKMFGAQGPDSAHPLSVHTAGWIQVLGVDGSVATATVVHACDGIMLDDYLQPFTVPMIAARPVPGSQAVYSNMGHITTGDQNMQNIGTGQMVGIDRGSQAGVVLGQRYLVFRDKTRLRNEGREYSATYLESVSRLPLVEVAEVLVVGVKPDHATVQVIMAKDSVMTGDLIAEIR